MHAGANHPKVGIVLTCVARMYKLKAKSEGSSSIMVQEVSTLFTLRIVLSPQETCYPSLLSLPHALWRLCRKFMLGLNDLFSILWLQGLYRKALEVLKAPAINSEGKITIFYLCWCSFPSFDWYIDVIYMLQVPANRWIGEISSPSLEVISLDYLFF
jgi:hypothetical protein